MSDKETKKMKKDKAKETESEKAPEQEKVMTSYDRKLQRRKQEQEREKREKVITRIVSAAVIVAVVALVASFPIRKYVMTHEAFVVVGGEKVTRAEFDYKYSMAVNNYISQYGSYLSYFGLDTTQDFATQMYSEDMTWKDYFEQLAAENITNSKALKKEADAAGFTYDASEEVKKFEESARKAASEANISLADHLKQLYGNYITLNNLKEYLAESLRESAYYDKIAEEKAPSDDEIQSFYERNKVDYDEVDFYQTIIEAELPTEPTELADPVEETDGADADSEDTEYQPSEAEINKAMEDAKKVADATDPKSGALMEKQKSGAVNYVIREWLFDETRKEGDTTVIENSSSNNYYVLSFVKRTLDNSATADLRAIITQEMDGETILNEWKAGAATEESFEELYKKYSDTAGSSSGGSLIKGVTPNGLEEVLTDWIFAPERKAGDTTALVTSANYNYVLYYVGQGDPEWKNSISDTLTEETMMTYMQNISAAVTVEDKKGHLKYLKVQDTDDADGSEVVPAE